MHKILILGAGRSSSYLIDYLAKAAQHYHWEVIIADQSLATMQEKVSAYPHIQIRELDVFVEAQLVPIVQEVDLVISLLPASMQSHIGHYCLELNSFLITASYLPPDLKEKAAQIQKKKLLFLNELGLDPGIDHMSAMQMIEEIKQQGGQIQNFQSHAGALIAPHSDNNPWGYKFTWNPRNVVTAGQGACAQYLWQDRFKYIPYHQLFSRTLPIYVDSLGDFKAYANRDSLRYQEAYGLKEVKGMLRGTLRRPGFCDAWNILVKLGLTDSQTVLQKTPKSYRAFLEAFLQADPNSPLSPRQNIAQQLGLDEKHEALDKIAWLDLFSDRPLKMAEPASPAQILQKILEEKWQLSPDDCDMIVMQHQIEYIQANKRYRRLADMVVMGESASKTAIAKTVGLPLAIAAKLIMQGKITLTGVHLPLHPSIYNPILEELTDFGIQFREKLLPI